jgi:hypothetical protein
MSSAVRTFIGVLLAILFGVLALVTPHAVHVIWIQPAMDVPFPPPWAVRYQSGPGFLFAFFLWGIGLLLLVGGVSRLLRLLTGRN